MILSALNSYYETLLAEGKVEQPGWTTRKVTFVLELAQDGSLRNIVPAPDGGLQKVVPEQVKRASGIVSNFLCDNSTYFLGIDAKGKPTRSARCFEAARELHHEMLDEADSPVARSVLAFFDRWNPEAAGSHEAVARAGEDLLKGGNLIFSVLTDAGMLFPTEDREIIAAWDRHGEDADNSDDMVCLVTGKRAPVARLHPSIKGLRGAQASGATLVGFNAPSFESYGHDGEQGRNAPVSVGATQAYAAALNYLLSDPLHHAQIGDTTVVFWSEHHDEGNAEAFDLFTFRSKPQRDKMDPKAVDATIGSMLENYAKGKPIGSDVDLSARFYILGLAPNSARVAVRFFLQDEFGSMLDNIAKHYRQLQIVHVPGLVDHSTPYWLLRAVENENSSKPVVSSELSASFLQAILSGTRYPESLYQNALLRVHATQEVTYERAAIVKAYLLRNRNRSEEEITVTLNEELTEQAYLLGRLFALFENIQKRANGTVTITSRYFNAANTTPAAVFPTLYKLSLAHLGKIERDAGGLARYFAGLRNELLTKARVGDEPMRQMTFPKRLTVEQQGSFILGYEMQRRNPWKKDEQAAEQENEINEGEEN